MDYAALSVPLGDVGAVEADVGDPVGVVVGDTLSLKRCAACTFCSAVVTALFIFFYRDTNSPVAGIHSDE